MNYWFLLAAIPVFGVSVLIHELGHFLAAKWVGIRVEEFGLGLPPRLIGLRKREGRGWEVIWGLGARATEDSYESRSVSSAIAEKHHHTIYSLNWLPIGGFVRMPGENGERNEEGNYDPASFAAKTAGKRLTVLTAGVIMNMLLAMVLFMFAYGLGEPTYPPLIGTVEAGSPAAAAGLRPGDTFVLVNGQKVQQFSDVVNITTAVLNQHPGAATVPIPVVIRHQGQHNTVEATIYARAHPPQGQGAMGIGEKVVLVSSPFWLAPVKGIQQTYTVTSQFISTIGQMIAGISKPQIVGPLGVIEITGRVAQSVPDAGWWPILSLTAILNINLAIVNILPFPALDGGRISLILVELLRGGKRLKPEVEGIINLVGMAILLTLIAIVTLSDILHWNSLL